jgi:hypothetical protein
VPTQLTSAPPTAVQGPASTAATKTYPDSHQGIIVTTAPVQSPPMSTSAAMPQPRQPASMNDLRTGAPIHGNNTDTINRVYAQDYNNNSSYVQSSQATTCKLNAQGLFGTPVGTVSEVSYSYQVVLTNATTLYQFRTTIVPALDAAIATAMLPYFFNCQPSQRQRRRLQTMQAPVIQAVSSRPMDIPILRPNCKYNMGVPFIYAGKMFVVV